ncbi:hypothetical protein AB0J90_05400 [Micromonospora sp. NPDC049523]|uniref:hypothetical protein n=1 Tax=Micromonospora sp. NPDC049523 TaxID=3155921 RepID=UPI00341B4F4B
MGRIAPAIAAPTTTGDDVGFVMVKPDGVADPAILADIRHSLGAAGLAITEVWDVELNHDDLKWLWPQHVNVRCPMTSYLLDRYLANAPSRIMTVTGTDAVARSNAIKLRIRQRYGYGPFANCIHTPANDAESHAQASFLRSSRADRLRTPVPVLSDRRGVYGRVAEMQAQTLRDIAETVRRRARTERWDRMTYTPIGAGPAALLLCDDNVNSIDYAVSSLCTVFPRLSVGDSLVAVLRAAQEPFTVAYGTEDEVAGWAARLRAAGQIIERRVVASREAHTSH